MTTVPPREPVQVRVVRSALLLLSKVIVLPERLNVPLWVKLCSMVMAVPL